VKPIYAEDISPPPSICISRMTLGGLGTLGIRFPIGDLTAFCLKSRFTTLRNRLRKSLNWGDGGCGSLRSEGRRVRKEGKP
jgi:hypothetical protein